jgi:hypothetical protein
LGSFVERRPEEALPVLHQVPGSIGCKGGTGMTDRYPFIPPSALIEKWQHGAFAANDIHMAFYWAARWGADQELKACCEWLSVPCPSYGRELRAARRPKPPSLKEQALAVLDEWCEQENGPGESIICNGLHVRTIRQALEQLND